MCENEKIAEKKDLSSTMHIDANLFLEQKRRRNYLLGRVYATNDIRFFSFFFSLFFSFKFLFQL